MNNVYVFAKKKNKARLRHAKHAFILNKQTLLISLKCNTQNKIYLS